MRVTKSSYGCLVYFEQVMEQKNVMAFSRPITVNVKDELNQIHAIKPSILYKSCKSGKKLSILLLN
uniref:Uncharacterized protein n=1 Tax=Rhizophora mucronata TaxID=61149 RepID=A0A2P2P312_RHIMU